MDYKTKIKELRKSRTAILANLELIADEMIYFDDKEKDILLSLESNFYIILLLALNKDIAKLQPWYRKLIGVLY